MTPTEISYALAKQVPDMARGFTIQTSYGDIVIEPGWMAKLLAAQVRVALEVESVAQLDGALFSDTQAEASA
jgi:hypothetical protein